MSSKQKQHYKFKIKLSSWAYERSCDADDIYTFAKQFLYGKPLPTWEKKTL